MIRSMNGAMLDESRTYRYRLWRTWDKSGPKVVFVMLNPSTADESLSDKTLDKCVGFAKQWGCGSLEIVNLFAYRTSKPEQMKYCDHPVGLDNDQHILEAIKDAATVVGAWGDYGGYLLRCRDVIRLITPIMDIHCLGITNYGHPKHPLYIATGTPLQVYWPKCDH